MNAELSSDNVGGTSPKASVIMPVYNGEKFLESSVRSVIAQSYSDWELIAVDDGSTDGSIEVLSRLAAEDDRIRVISQENGGVSSARNRGISESRGSVLFFIDCDDLFHPRALETMLAVMEREEADVVVGCMIESDSEPAGWRSRTLAVDGKGMRRYNAEEAIEAGLYQRPLMNAIWQMCVSRAIFNRGVRFVEGQRYEDLEIFWRIFAEGRRIVYIPAAIYFYRQHGASYMHEFTRGRLDVLKVTSDIEEGVRRRFPAISSAASDRRMSACFNMYLILSGRREEEYRRIKAECWAEIKKRRLQSLLNPRVRMKNRLGALLSYLGPGLIRVLGRVAMR